MQGERLALTDELWRHVEPYHAVVYFAPEHRRACDGLGLRSGWMAYFASRVAPLGAVGAGLVTALFYSFHPAMVARALPDAWRHATPVQVLAARYAGVDLALRRILGRVADSDPVWQAALLATAAVSDLEPGGRPMFAANAALDWPDEPHLALWHASTLLREHRGDGHVAALMGAGIDGCQAHVLQVASGDVPRNLLQPHRGYSAEDWDAATAALQDRGWLAADGTLTARGRLARAEVSDSTTRLASGPVAALGDHWTRTLLAALSPVVAAVRAAGDVPYPNPMGVPPPGRSSGLQHREMLRDRLA